MSIKTWPKKLSKPVTGSQSSCSVNKFWFALLSLSLLWKLCSNINQHDLIECKQVEKSIWPEVSANFNEPTSKTEIISNEALKLFSKASGENNHSRSPGEKNSFRAFGSKKTSRIQRILSLLMKTNCETDYKSRWGSSVYTFESEFLINE